MGLTTHKKKIMKKMVMHDGLNSKIVGILDKEIVNAIIEKRRNVGFLEESENAIGPLHPLFYRHGNRVASVIAFSVCSLFSVCYIFSNPTAV